MATSESARIVISGLDYLQDCLKGVTTELQLANTVSDSIIAQAVADADARTKLERTMASQDLFMEAIRASTGFWDVCEQISVRDALHNYAKALGQTKSAIKTLGSNEGTKDMAMCYAPDIKALKKKNEDMFCMIDTLLGTHYADKETLLGLPTVWA